VKKDELQDKISELRDGWEAVIADLGPDGLEKPGANGEWRVRDVIAHMNAWDRWQLVQLRSAFSGETPTNEELVGGIDYPEAKSQHEDDMNASFYEGTKDLPLDVILSHFREITKMRSDWVDAADPERLNAVIGGDWGGGTSRIFRLASEVPHLSNPEPVWRRLNDQLEHQRRHLGDVGDRMG
jgi:hypothetical protein